MSLVFSHRPSRRLLLRAGVGLALGPLLRAASVEANSADEIRLKAAPARAKLADGLTDVLTYNGTLPGPILRLKQRQPARIILENGLEEATTMHWHGIRLPNAMDGVPGLTQAPIKPGESFTYEFTPPDAGTFWYHPHVNSLQQIGRGWPGC